MPPEADVGTVGIYESITLRGLRIRQTTTGPRRLRSTNPKVSTIDTIVQSIGGGILWNPVSVLAFSP